MSDITIAEKLVRTKADLDTINEEVVLQGGIIAQIQEALRAKSAVKSYDTEIINRSISGNYTNEHLDMVGAYAFYGCSNLTSVTFPACDNIETFAFGNCENLLTASFAACDVSDYAFENCEKLQEILFSGYNPSSNYFFADYAFNGCSSLHTVILNSDEQFEIGQSLTNKIAGGMQLYVHSSLLSAYTTGYGAYNVVDIETLPETSVFYNILIASHATELSMGDESTSLE